MRHENYLLSFVLLIGGCSFIRTDIMDETTSLETSTTFTQRANELYEVASKCWSSSPLPLIYGTRVEKSFTIDEAIIIARWYPIIGGETDPIIKFIVIKTDNGSLAKVFEREHAFLTKRGFKKDALRWLKGEYTCS